MNARTLIFILSIWLFGTCITYGIADDFEWPRWRGPNGDGISKETNWDPKVLAGGPKILWKANLVKQYFKLFAPAENINITAKNHINSIITLHLVYAP